MSRDFKINKKGEIIYFTVQSFDEQNGIVHGFSTRHGGASVSPYASLNLGFHTGDSPEAVRENLQRFCHALGIDPQCLVIGQQVHEDKIKVVTSRDAGDGSAKFAISATDALITQDIDVALLAFFADCVPILIYDPVKRAIGVVHAGWRGTVLQIGAKTVKAMEREFGTNPADCLIGIGPSIGACCYEVDSTVIDIVKQTFPYWQDLLEEKDSKHANLDLWAANRQSLIDAGVEAEHISVSGMCTKCNQELLFSFRGEGGVTGRLAALIKLK